MILELVAVGGAAFAAATLAAVTGFGGAVVLLPVLVWTVGTKDAVIVLTIAQLIGNGSRVVLNRQDVDGTVVGRFALGAVPLALAGGLLFATASASVLTRILGVFLLASVAWRHLADGTQRAPRLAAFIPLGAVFGFLSALLGSVGPLMAPFFLAYGLVRSAYIGTEAACTIVMHTTKLVAYGGGGILSAAAAWKGLALAPVMVAGSWTGKRLLDRTSEELFVALIEVVIIAGGVLLLVSG